VNFWKSMKQMNNKITVIFYVKGRRYACLF
jgi:hypothetical protein